MRDIDWEDLLMKLQKSDANLFFKLMWSLHLYANGRLRLYPRLGSNLKRYASTRTEIKNEIRTAVYDNYYLLDEFITENPQRFTAVELRLLRSWRQAIMGDFYVERFLKQGAIFISRSPNPQIFLVQGLHESLADFFADYDLPLLVSSVLLPFKGRIIYDGLLDVYDVALNSKIKRDLREMYGNARRQDLLYTSLGSYKNGRSTTPKWETELETIVQLTAKLRANRRQPLQSPVFGLLKASAKLAETAVCDPDNADELWAQYKKARQLLNKIEATLERIA